MPVGLYDKASQTSGLPIWQIAAIMYQESAFDPSAYADDANGGTWGLFQMNRIVWRSVHEAGAWNETPDGITDPMIHAEYGGKYLKERLENIRSAKQQYPTADFANISDLDALVIAHNAGETTLINYPDKLPDITKNYLSDVHRLTSCQ